MKQKIQSFGGFPVITKSVTDRIKEGERKNKEAMLTLEIEHTSNTAVFLFYIALIYMFDLCIQAEKTWDEKERKSKSINTMIDDLLFARNKMQLVLENFLSHADTNGSIFMGLILDDLIYKVKNVTENQIDAIFSAISRYYLTENKEYSSTDKAFLKAKFIAHIIHTRRMIVMAISSLEIAQKKYGKDFPLLYELIKKDDLNSCLEIVHKYFLSLTKKISNVDLSLHAGCADAQLQIIKFVSQANLFDVLSKNKKALMCK